MFPLGWHFRLGRLRRSQQRARASSSSEGVTARGAPRRCATSSHPLLFLLLLLSLGAAAASYSFSFASTGLPSPGQGWEGEAGGPSAPSGAPPPGAPPSDGPEVGGGGSPATGRAPPPQGQQAFPEYLAQAPFGASAGAHILIGRGGGMGDVSEPLSRNWGVLPGEQFMWYSAHSGFGNQVVQLKWALRVAAYLNRTLILPPKLPHRSPVPSIGRCERYPTRQAKIRHEAWVVYMSLLRSDAYVSIADVLDIASLPSSIFQTIDLRNFVMAYCQCDVRPSCVGPMCMKLHDLHSVPRQSHKESRACLIACGDKLGARERQSPPWEAAKKLSRVEYNCADTVYTIKNYSRLRDVVSSIGPGQLHILHPSVYAASDAGKAFPRPVQLSWAFGSRTRAGSATVLAFGSCFHPRIVDFHLNQSHPIPYILKVTYSIPFTPPIMTLAQSFVYKNIKEPFACMHLRGGDGFFRQLFPQTLKQAEAQLNRLLEHVHSVAAKEDLPHREGTNSTDRNMSASKISLFLMTDLVRRRLRKTFVAKLPSKGVSVMTSDDLAHVPQDVGRLIRLSEIGLYGNRVPDLLSTTLRNATATNKCESNAILNSWIQRAGDLATHNWKQIQALEDLMLFFEQAVCCLNTLGMISTYRSTVSGLIQATKLGGHCQTTLDCFRRNKV